ncbi:MAG: methylmalonyl-CoA epimerase [Chloroflexi bacterium RBG_13_54_8]|nr:MAG: methylmalonyl-CoA epimerase [Chloroflexi bacterium RBG_13_54_8]
MIMKVDHIAIAVSNLDEALGLYDRLFDLRPEKVETVPQQRVKAAILPTGEGTQIELIQPTDSDSGVAKFLERRGEGIHHIAIEVEDIGKELKTLASKGVELIDKEPRLGLAGKVAFVHPKSTRGVLIELVQKI